MIIVYNPDYPLYLDFLVDVVITTPALNDVLKYNGTNWVNGPAPAGTVAQLSDIGDVDVTGILDGYVLAWDTGTSTWIAVDPCCPNALLIDGSRAMTGTLNMGEGDVDNVGNLIHNEVAVTDFTIQNVDLDKDIILSVNDGGSQTPVLKIVGATSTVDLLEHDLDNVKDIIHDQAVASDFTVQNIDLDKDIILSVNDGGSQTPVLKIVGATSTAQILNNLDMDSNKIVNLADGTAQTDAITLGQLESVAQFFFDFYFNNTADGIGGIYYQMTDSVLGGVESTLSTAGLTGIDDQPLVNFIQDVATGITQLTAGVYNFHFHAQRTAGTRDINIYAELYTRTAGGTETLIATSGISGLVTAKAAFTISAVLAADVVIAGTTKLVVKFYANGGVAGSNATVALYQEGDTNSALIAPTTSAILSNIFLRLDGTNAMSADLNMAENDLDNVKDIIHDQAVASDLNIINQDQDKDIIFKGNDGGVDTEIMKLDVSAGQLAGIIKATAGVLGAASDGTDYISSVVADTTPQLGGELDTNGHSIGGTVYDNGNSGATKSIDLKIGNNQKITLTADCTITLIAPTKAGTFVLEVVQDVTGNWAVTWAGATIVWADGVTDYNSQVAASKSVIVSFYFNGAKYYGTVTNFTS